MEKFVEKQYTISRRIFRIYENMQKLGAAKITKGVVTSRLELLEKTWATFLQAHDELMDVCEGKERTLPYFTEDYLGQTEEAYLEQKGMLLDRLEKLSATKETVATAKDNHRNLPAIDLPTFSGGYQSWPNFRDLFQSIILDNDSLTEVERFHYLKTSLRGEPSLLLQNVAVTHDHFRPAWKTIVDRYENKRLIINSQLSSLMALPAILKESADGLKHLLNGTLDAIQGLQALQRPVKYWSDWLLFITVQRVDAKTRMGWETSIGNTTEPPSFEQLRTFLEGRIRALEAVEQTPRSLPKPLPSVPNPKGLDTVRGVFTTNRPRAHVVIQSACTTTKCPLCSEEHLILNCREFKLKSPQGKRDIVTEKKLCFNCLGFHLVKFCKSSKRCQTCLGKHHTCLHGAGDTTAHNSKTQNAGAGLTSLWCRATNRSPTPNILATALVKITAESGEEMQVRALIDPCSEVSLIQERQVQTLRLPRISAGIPVMGVAGQESKPRGSVIFKMSSMIEPSFQCMVNALVLPRITSYCAVKKITPDFWPHIAGLQLADCFHDENSGIDILLGAEIYAQIIQDGVLKGPPNTPIAQRTTLGWILTGPGLKEEPHPNYEPLTSLHCTSDIDLRDWLQRFWELEEIATRLPTLTEEERYCNEHFCKTHSRDYEGRYIVRLPLAQSSSKLGDSKLAAQHIFWRIEKQLQRNGRLQEAYKGFMEEYLTLRHMEPVAATGTPPVNYLPHHGIWKPSSTTTKLRVVFNGSHKTTTGVSLNDILHKGPNLLPDINSLLLRWRMYQIVFSADIEKMFRQIRLHSADADLQRILWRNTPTETIKEYRLLTITYGLACAPFLAVKTLHQLAEDERDSFPLASSVLKRDTYMDDIITGANTIQEAKELQTQLISLLKAGGFHLRKWTANAREILQDLNEDSLAISTDFTWNADGVHTLLGLKWDSHSDNFLFTIKSFDTTMLTKRKILSDIARLYDPLGLIAPVIITAKIFMQSLWLLNIGWDDPLPSAQTSFWEKFREELNWITLLRIPRWVSTIIGQDTVQLHGYCDASERAYAAVVYLRATWRDGSHKVTILTAKTRVAPLKQISLPRLELCAATLLTKLVNHVRKTMNLSGIPIFLWSDSTVVLSWLQGQPTRWKTFVANRVSEIQTTLPSAHWMHITSPDNPADCASRGLLGSELLRNYLWLQGPKFLLQDEKHWPTSKLAEATTDLETRTKARVHLATTPQEGQLWEVLTRYSTLPRLLRILSWVMRFLQRTRKGIRDSYRVYPTYLTVEELRNARLLCTRLAQRTAFAKEIQNLIAKKPIKGPLLRLNPFIDNSGLCRVGGRLKHSLLDYDEMHPIILPEKGHFTRLLIRDCHLQLLHASPQLTLATLRRRYWILCGRRVVRNVIHNCVKCFRWRASPTVQQMGNLPAPRVTPSKPFLNTGIDYAGPFYVKALGGRGHKTKKAYVVVFICLATRAVHLELVSDYTTEAFLAAYKRFIARRGHCATLYSDCGTNLVGAALELRRLFSMASSEMERLSGLLAQEGTEWHFNPPAAPHFGGIWEAAVKSLKFHIRRVIGDTPLTFEELSTVLVQIEACLNSRPLTPLTDEPDDIQPLTPGHFLIGAPLIAIPEPSLADERTNRLTRWQLLRQMQEHFWRRWSREYLQSLQPRGKWTRARPNPQVGDLCVLLNELLPPTKWPMARITDVHPGNDGKVRVVTLRTPVSTFKRPITKICLLPRDS